MPKRLPTAAVRAAVLAASLLATPAVAAEPVQARLSIGSEPSGPRIEPEVYGHFVEHLGQGVYGGLWVGPESPIPNTRGWRNDVLAALRHIGVPVMRWPGGCFADDYDWRDGIGPPAQRPRRLNKFWGMAPEPNRVGTHEFLDLVELLGSQAYIAGNMGSLPPRALSQWLEYMTSDSPHSSLAAERRRNGRAKPWRIPFVGIGNESWGCGGHMRPEYQADLHRQYVTWLHTPAKRVASGDGEGRDEVTEVLMARAGQHMDALTLHHYTVPAGWQKKGRATEFDERLWALALHDAVVGLEDHVARTIRIMDRHDPDRRVALYVDEWGMWHDPEPGAEARNAHLYQQGTMRDALVAALAFHVFHRHTARVKMANIAQMVNVLQALVLTDGPRLLLTPTYHVFDLYRPFRGALPLPVVLDTPEYREGEGPSAVTLPAVAASAARGEDGRVHIALVNLDPRRPAQVTLPATAPLRGRMLHAATLQAHNRHGETPAVTPRSLEAAPRDGRITLTLPPAAVAVMTAGP